MILTVLFSTGCPRCLELKKLLERAGIEYEIISNVEQILNSGIDRVPVLQVESNRMDFKEAKEWIDLYIKEKQR